MEDHGKKEEVVKAESIEENKQVTETDIPEIEEADFCEADSPEVEDSTELGVEDLKLDVSKDFINGFSKLLLQLEEKDTILDHLLALKQTYGKELYNVKKNKPGDIVNILTKIWGTTSLVIDHNLDSLRKEAPGSLMKSYKDSKRTFVDTSRKAYSDYGGKTLSGKEAQLAIKTAGRTTKKIRLFGSCMRLQLVAPVPSDLNTCYNAIIDRIGEYQWEFGNNLFLFHDFAIKEVIADMVYDLIVDCDYEHWQDKNKFLRALKFNDWQHLLHAVGTLMYEKYPYYYPCSGKMPDGNLCNHVEELDIDLKLCKRTAFSKIPEKAKDILDLKAKKTDEDLIKYHELLGLTKTIPIYGQFVGNTKVPSMFDYFQYGRSFNMALESQLYGYKDEGEEELLIRRNKLINTNIYKIFTIWLSSVDILNEDGSLSARIESQSAISDTLDISSLETTKFGDDMLDWTKETTLTHIGIPVNACPECGHEPSRAVEGYVPFDCQLHFFLMSVMELTKIS